MADLSAYIHQITDGDDLSASDMQQAMAIMVSGDADPVHVAGFLTAQMAKGISIEELTGAVTALREKMTPFEVPKTKRTTIVDCCGTGGDGKHQLNISTAVAFVIAGCGVPVVKHGNKAVSSKSGSSDVLTELGVHVDVEARVMQRALDDAGICFLLAPLYHPAMKHVAPVRATLKSRTIFNLLGPLVNPATPQRQLIGVYDVAWLTPFAKVLQSLGATDALIVHGNDGSDELALSGSKAVGLSGGKLITEHDVPAFDKRAKPDALEGGEAWHNAKELRALLAGQRKGSAYEKAVFLNAVELLKKVAAEAYDDDHASREVIESIHGGKALAALDALVEITTGF